MPQPSLRTWRDLISADESTPYVDLHYEEHGEGEPVLLIHGFGANLYTWRHLIDPLSKCHRIIAIDLKGFGDSPKPADNRYSVYDHVYNVLRLIEKNNLDKITIVGNSFGGGVALITALYLQEKGAGKLKRLVLIDSVAYEQKVPPVFYLLRTPFASLGARVVPSKLPILITLMRAYFDRKKISDKTVSEYARVLDMPGGREAAICSARQIIPEDLRELSEMYRNIDVPVLIIWGAEDIVISASIGKRLHNDLPDSRLEIIEKCGHVPQEEEPDKTINFIEEFLEES